MSKNPSLMFNFAERLLEVTKECRPDMHEPDEQGLRATVSGRVLDNAMGDDPNSNELVVTIWGTTPTGTFQEHFNLATLIALARIGSKAMALSDEIQTA